MTTILLEPDSTVFCNSKRRWKHLLALVAVVLVFGIEDFGSHCFYVGMGELGDKIGKMEERESKIRKEEDGKGEIRKREGADC